jgi:hypothetical protein
MNRSSHFLSRNSSDLVIVRQASNSREKQSICDFRTCAGSLQTCARGARLAHFRRALTAYNLPVAYCSKCMASGAKQPFLCKGASRLVNNQKLAEPRQRWRRCSITSHLRMSSTLKNAWSLEVRTARAKDRGRLVFGSYVRSVSPITLPTGRIFMRSQGSILCLSFKQFAANSASVNVSRAAAGCAAARHARNT